ncbi:uncharacterized protein BDR25DRAFT_363950 [Lindgomyces ingoldianus]|uniref:Uncharacterized protein n=1 Tax=Lindgomyces ingoldianus TaxID=673940 RepID=A0ACB6Q7M6_9PLEO|nr:uncharacterized protein BDR25DRAFT_363950 [Lindgomyces ingoldianus]KAF2462535.1 hypothetical protein BDR25DRAFT_363950 [Lindgomyces ingoldianus]
MPSRRRLFIVLRVGAGVDCDIVQNRERGRSVPEASKLYRLESGCLRCGPYIISLSHFMTQRLQAVCDEFADLSRAVIDGCSTLCRFIYRGTGLPEWTSEFKPSFTLMTMMSNMQNSLIELLSNQLSPIRINTTRTQQEGSLMPYSNFIPSALLGSLKPIPESDLVGM